MKNIDQHIHKMKSLLCVGLDPVMEKLPERFQKEKHAFFAFNKWIIDQTQEYAIAFKPNAAFYEARGASGWEELEMTAEYLQKQLPDHFHILDAKRADIESTNDGYVSSIFDHMNFDAVTLHPYLGKQAMQPFLSRQDKVSIILCRTSNPGSGEIQDQVVGGKPLWQCIAEKVRDEWNEQHNCMLVVGATYPEELGAIRRICPDMFFLVPGVGVQGGNLHQVLKYGLTKSKSGLIISSSRSIIFAERPNEEARALQSEMASFL